MFQPNRVDEGAEAANLVDERRWEGCGPFPFQLNQALALVKQDQPNLVVEFGKRTARFFPPPPPFSSAPSRPPFHHLPRSPFPLLPRGQAGGSVPPAARSPKTHADKFVCDAP